MIDLLPCPFCGGAPKNTEYFGNYNKADWCVHCAACDLSLDGDPTPEEAAKRWNTRASGVAQAARVASLPLEWRKEAVRHSNAAADEDCDIGGEEWRLHREASRIYKKCANDLDDALSSLSSTDGNTP